MPSKDTLHDKIKTFEIHIAEFRKNFEEIRAYQEKVPKICLLKSREMAEGICKQIYLWTYPELPKWLTLNKMITRLSEERVIPRYIVAPLRTIQSYGNVGAHFQGNDSAYITAEYVQPCLDSLAGVLEWYAAAYHPAYETTSTAPVPKQRRIDAAAPGSAGIRQHIDLLVQVRFPNSPLLGTEERLAKQTLASTERISELVTLRFPVDEVTGMLSPAHLLVKVNAPDFIIQGAAQKQIEVPPEDYSNAVSFLMTAQKKGLCRIHVEVYNLENVCLGTIPFETNVEEAPASPVNVTNLFLVVGVENQEKDDVSLEHAFSSPPNLPQFHIVLENKQIIHLLSKQALFETASEQAPMTAGLIEALLEMAARGEIVTQKSVGNVAGGFGGGADLMVMSLVPVMIEVIAYLLNKVGEITLADVKQAPEKIAAVDHALAALTAEDIQDIVKRTGALLAKGKTLQVLKAIRNTIHAYLRPEPEIHT